MPARMRCHSGSGRRRLIGPRGSSGLTLLEVCVVLALLAMLSSLAGPGLRSSLRAAAVRAAAFELMGALHRVRAQSILEARTGALCLSGSAGGCLSSPASGASWQSWLESPREQHNLGAGTVPRGVVVHANRSPLRFWPHVHTASPATLTICDEQAVARPRAIIVSQTGRARLTNAPADACRA